MKELPNFKIQQNGEISNEFLKRNIYTFSEATKFIQSLNYGRNENKNDLKTFFIDNCGTCSTKHSVLKKLAEENNENDIKITKFKVEYHQNYLQNWLNRNDQVKLSLNELWKIREECIQNLATN